MKHSGDKKDISLSKAGSNGSMYSDVKNLSGEDENISMFGIDGGFLLGSVVTIPKAKQINTSAGFGSLLGSPNFHMDNDEVVLPSRLLISLEKKWFDPKIIKTPVEVSVKKSFALDINLSAKNFLNSQWFWGATISSKFEGIIRSMFTSEKSMEMATSLAGENKIVVNTDLKKQGVHSDWAVVIKEISMDMPKNMIVTAVTEFGKIKLIRIQLIRMWQKTVVKFTESNSVRVAKTVGDCNVWTSRDQFRVLLFTLPVGMTAHDLGTLLERAGEKTCIINRFLETGNRFRYAVIGFESNEELESAFLTEPIFCGIRLSWARLDLVWCGKCGHFGHSVLKCDVFEVLPLVSSKLLKRPFLGVNCLQLARLYAKKNVLISCPTAFGDKSWAQIVSSASSSGGFSSNSGLFSGGMPSVVVGLNNCLVVLEHSLEILSDQVSVILKKLSFVDLVLLAALSLAVSVPLALVVDSDMAMDDVLASANLSFSGSSESATVLSSSGSKVLISKVGGLEFKMAALEASSLVFWFRFVFGLFVPISDLVWKVATYNICGINISAKQEDVVRWHFDSRNLILIITETKLRSSTRPWIVNKFNGVRIFSLGLDKSFLGAGVAIIMAESLACHVAKIEEIPGHVMVVRLLFKNKLSVSVVGLYVGASSRTCFGQAFEVNSVIAKAVNSSCFVILSGNFNENRSGKSASFKFCLGLGLVNSFAGHPLTINFIFVSKSLVSAVTGHEVGSVSDFFDTDHCAVSVSVGLGGLLDGWLNNLHKQANKDHWKFLIKSWFRDCASAKLLAVSDRFLDILACADVDGMNKFFSKFFRLELLVAKVVKGLELGNLQRVNQLINVWAKLDDGKTAMIANMIQKAIEYHMEKFCSDKGAMIRSVLDQFFHKVVLDYLVVNDELVLEPSLTKKKMVLLVVPDI
ncbi:hypothetical protein G9A89_002006 [Geosiphon pyriformis]|nr:hypothetical protein G9A89_002006 [Geosiphon pyriformis]